jgi:amidohydrolase
MRAALWLSIMTAASTLSAATLNERIDAAAAKAMPKVIECRRNIHQHPELGNREFRTSKLVADRLRELGIEVKTPVAHTGVIGLLRGGKPGRVVALRADMDALPVTQQVDLPFKSTVRTTYNGQETGVMHACGHDAHVAILLGVAEVLASVRDEIPGTVKFLFQPAEEGAPAGEEGGAELMVKEGALENPKVDAAFGLHVTSRYPVGEIAYKPGAQMAAVDSFQIVVHGKQTHGAYPWLGVDPIVVAAQIVLGLQTIPSRQLDVSLAPSIVTVARRAAARRAAQEDQAHRGGHRRQRRRHRRRDHHPRVSDHLQRSRAHREDGADAARAHRRRDRRSRHPRRGGLLVLPAESPRPLLLARHAPPEPDRGGSRLQPLAALLRRRERPAARGAGDGEGGGGLVERPVRSGVRGR